MDTFAENFKKLFKLVFLELLSNFNSAEIRIFWIKKGTNLDQCDNFDNELHEKRTIYSDINS